MKTLFIAALCAVAIEIHGQSSASLPANTTPEPTQINDMGYAVVGREANSRVWQRTTYEQSPTGEMIPHLHSYTELATGLHYQKDGQWVESKEEIELLPNGGAAATQGQHQVYFPADVYTGVIEVIAADGKHLKSRPVGLCYFDGTNSVFIAELTNSIGQLLSSNQVIYTNCFTDLAADLVCSYRKSGFESDLVFREQLPTPEMFGMNSANSRLELLTEFFDAPEPEQVQAPAASSASAVPGSSSPVAANVPQLNDPILNFGSMAMAHGKAFSVGGSAQEGAAPFGSAGAGQIPVAKTWAHIGARTFLIEEVLVDKITPQLRTLPASSTATAPVAATGLRRLSPMRLLPPARMVEADKKASKKILRMAQVDVARKPGVVLDYNEIDDDSSDFTFTNGCTYFIPYDVDFFGNTTIQGGAIIKSDGWLILISGNLICDTTVDHPAILTSWNDNSVGETIGGSSGHPSVDYATAIWNGGASVTNYHGLKIMYAFFGIQSYVQLSPISSCQFLNCSTAVDVQTVSSPAGSLHNVLIGHCDSALQSPDSAITLEAQHLTADQCRTFFDTPSSSTAYLTNSLLTSVTNTTGVQTNHSSVVSSGTGIYKTIQRAAYYLANNTYRNIGTTNIASNLLTGIWTMTTYSPQDGGYPDNDGLPDLGYHYSVNEDSDFDGVPDYLEPWITSQPQSQNAVQGDNVTFSVTAGGIAPLGYQWRFNGANITGANASTLARLVVTNANEGNYSVVVNNGSGSVTSSVAVLTVNIRLTNGTPMSQTALEGAKVTFTNLVTGNHPVYLWYTNGVKMGNSTRITGTSTSILTITNVSVADALNYVAVATNLCNSVTSPPAVLTVIAKPGVSLAPTNTVVIQSDDVTLSGMATGVDLHYQWWLTNSLVTTNISGATQSSYSKLVVQTNDGGHYSLAITNRAGSTNVNADLTVLVPPWITQQPVSVVTNQGSSVSFSISAFGTTNLFYQWYKNGTNAIANATNSSLTLVNVQTNDAASYSVLVTNIAGTNFSARAWLSVNPTGGGATVNGWGAGGTNSAISIAMIGPSNTDSNNPAIYLYQSAISIRASAFSVSNYTYITNVAFYSAITNYQYASNYVFLGNAVPGANRKFAFAWTNAQPGTNVLKARAWDCYGNTNDSPPVFVVMDQAPVVTCSPSAITLVWEGINTNVWFTNHVTDDSLPYRTNDFIWNIPAGVTISNIYTTNAPFDITIATMATFTNWGLYPLQLNVTDGFATGSSTCAVTIKHRPAVSFNWPTNNAAMVVGSDSMVLEASASDLDGTVANVKFYYGAGLTLIGDGTWRPNDTYRYDWSSAAQGVYTITAIATDNEGYTNSANVIASVVPPLTIQFQSPTNGQFFVLSPTNILLTALLTNYGGWPLTSVTFSNVTQSRYIGSGTLTNSTYQTVWTDVTNGTYTLNVTARDSAGNIATNGVIITVNAMPVIQIIAPTNTQSFLEITNVQLTAIASDAEDGTNVSVSFYYTNGLIGSATHSGGATNSIVWTGRTANYQPTNYYPIVAVATDSKGARSASQIVVFKVARTIPTPSVAITFPTNGATFPPYSDVTITAAATNFPASVTNVEFFVNGQSIGSDPESPYSINKCCWKPGTYVLIAKATDSSNEFSFSNPITNIISQELPKEQGFWDADFGLAAKNAVWYSALGVSVGALTAGPDGSLYAASDDMYPWDIDRYSDENWTSVGGMLAAAGEWRALLADGTNIYIGGYYTLGTASVFRWNGSDWESVGNSLYQTIGNGHGIETLAVMNSDLYIGGDFYSPDDSTVTYIAKLDRSDNVWKAVGNGLNGPVFAIKAIGGSLYIGGAFTNAGGNANANYIARLDGPNWTNLGSGVSGPTVVGGEVTSLAVCGSNLFAGGFFTTAGDKTNANGVARWVDNSWSTLSGGVQPSAGTMFGIFQNPEFGETNYSSLVSPRVYAVTVRGNNVFVGGRFDTVGNEPNLVLATNVAMATWDENSQTWTWSDLDGGVDGYGPYSMCSRLVINPNPTNGAYDLIVGGVFNSVGSGQFADDNVARWRVGYPKTGSPATVTITNPVNYAVYTNDPAHPLSLNIIASATSYTNLIGVDFFADGINFGSDSHDQNSPYAADWPGASWSAPTNGVHTFKAVATDINGLKGASKPLIITIKSTNNPITAIADAFVTPADSPALNLNVLTNDVPGTGLHISQIVRGQNSLGRAELSRDAQYIVYTPTPNVYGTDVFYYNITNASSASDSAPVTMTILPHPSVQIVSPFDGQRFGAAALPISVTSLAVAYGTSIDNVMLYTNNLLFNTLTNGATDLFATNWTASAAGFYTFVAVATDKNGLSATSSPVTVVLTNTTASPHGPVAAISNLSSTTINNLGVVTVDLPVIRAGVFDLLGQASDPDGDPVSYAVQLFRPEDYDFTISDDTSMLISITEPFADVTPGAKNAQGFHIGNAIGDLGNLDLTQVPDGVYDLVLRVRGGTDETNVIVRVQLQSDLKIGQFSFSEQDLVLPVNGIPLTVVRTYNSMNPRSGPFGANWTFALNDMAVELDDARTDVTIGSDNAPFDDAGDTDYNGLPKTVSVRTGGNWDVTLTLPDGRRTTFVFGYYGAWPELHATWTPPPGITARLEMDGDNGILFGYSGLSVPIWAGSDLATGHAPFDNQDIPSWTLTMQDGTKYHISRGRANNVYCLDPNGSGNYISARVYGPPKLAEIEELSGDKIDINDNGIFNYDPTNALTRWALLDHDSAGRIVALHDPNGGSNGLPVVKYVYNNDTGNLIQVLKLVDRGGGTYTTNKYYYDNVKFPHYITSIENGEGSSVARNFYDDSGRLTAVQDANGTLTQFNHSLTNNSEIVIDRLGHTNSYVYDLKGNVIWSTNALGQVTATAYNNPNNANLETAVTNAYGSAQATWTLYSYDSAGNQTNVISMGHTNSFQYDGAGNLLTQADPLGNITRNFYDSSGNLTNTTQYDANNNPVASSSSVYEYGKLKMTLNANGQTNATFGYDGSGNLTNTTDANGFSRGFSYDANGNQTGSSYQWTPPGGSPKTVTTTTAYDAQNRVIWTVDALGNTNRTFYNTLGKVDYTVDKFGNTNSFVYDALGNLIQTTAPNGTNSTVYDAAGRAYLTTDRNGVTGTRTDFDAAGRATNTVRLTNVIVGIIYSGSVAQSVVSSAGVPISTNSTVYDAAGRVTSRTSPDGTTSYDYYPDGQLMHVIDALNHTNFYAYDAAGRQTNAVDTLNHSTKFQYDAVGRMVKTVYNDNSFTTNIFDNLGQRTGIKDQAGLLTQFGYNVSGQLTNVVKPAVPDPENGGISTNAQWSYLYDSYGRPTVTIDPKGRGTTNFLDAYGRQFSQRLTMNQTNFIQYDSLGRVVTNFDFKGQWTRFCYDPFGRVRAKYFYTSAGNLSNSVCYQYNQLDQITNITERYGADAVNNSCTDCVAQVGPNGGNGSDSKLSKAWAAMRVTSPKWGAPLVLLSFLWLLLNSPVGRRLRNILAWYYLRGGWRLNFTTERRTKRLRLPSYFWRGITIVTLVVLIVDDPSWEYVFGQCSPPASSNLANSTLTTRITSYTYDFDGHLTQMNSPEGYINYGYDLATGRLANTCTTNSYLAYAYDALGRLHTVHVTKRNGSTVDETTTYGYDSAGNRSSVTLPNGVATSYFYDSLNRLTNLTHQAGTTNLATYRYTLDATGRRTNAMEILRQEDNTYLTNALTWQFDGMYRLTNEISVSTSLNPTYAYTNSYQYDLAGNRLHKVRTGGGAETINYGYDANDELSHETNGTAITAYLYDVNGSLTNQATGTTNYSYAYNLMNKLSGVVTATATNLYQYNDQGIRVRTMGPNPKYYLIDANNHTGYQQVLEEFSTLGGTPTMSYVMGDDVLAQANSSVSYLLGDGHGTTRQLANNGGGVSERYNYDAYGSVQATTSSSTAEYAADNNVTSKLYCGEQYDSTLKTYNLRARYYNPANGRFNQRDTFIGFNEDPQSLHKYSFANCDPVNGIDPAGHELVETLAVATLATILFVLLVIPFVKSGPRTLSDLISLEPLEQSAPEPKPDPIPPISDPGPPLPPDDEYGKRILYHYTDFESALEIAESGIMIASDSFQSGSITFPSGAYASDILPYDKTYTQRSLSALFYGGTQTHPVDTFVAIQAVDFFSLSYIGHPHQWCRPAPPDDIVLVNVVAFGPNLMDP